MLQVDARNYFLNILLRVTKLEISVLALTACSAVGSSSGSVDAGTSKTNTGGSGGVAPLRETGGGAGASIGGKGVGGSSAGTAGGVATGTGGTAGSSAQTGGKAAVAGTGGRTVLPAGTGGAPVPSPTCGDGPCNGSETSSTCCQDCGCPSGDTCTNNSCHCANEVFNFENVGSTTTATCSATGFVDRLYPWMNVQVTSGSNAWASEGTNAQVTQPWGTSETVKVFCCYVDFVGCIGNSTCNLPNGAAACTCTTHTVTITADTCPSEQVIGCSN